MIIDDHKQIENEKNAFKGSKYVIKGGKEVASIFSYELSNAENELKIHERKAALTCVPSSSIRLCDSGQQKT